LAYNPSLGVAEARDIATKHGDEMVIVLRINLATGLLKIASYGKTKSLCDVADRLSKSIHRHINEVLRKVINRLPV
jgi:hypothetical protein